MELGQWQCDPELPMHHMVAGERVSLFARLLGCSPLFFMWGIYGTVPSRLPFLSSCHPLVP